jgi:hypothetical protein
VLRGLLLFAGWPLLSAPAHADESAQPVPERKAGFAIAENTLRVSLSYRDVLTPELTQKLTSGLPLVVASRTYLLREGEAAPLALSVRTCRVTYDLWDEVYRIKVSSSSGERDLAVLNVEGVARQCLEFKDAALFSTTALTGKGPFFLGMIVQVNPVSSSMQKELRAWIARPAGVTGISPGDALFGSFVSLFTQRIAEGVAERTLRFRTQGLGVAPLPPTVASP